MRIILAYAGGLAATEAIPWLRARYRADVVTVTLDLGQGRALEAVRDRALAAGAVRAHVVDGREAFTRDVLVPALRGDVDGVSPRILAQAVLGPTLVDLARIERAVAVAHTCATGSGDRRRLEAAVQVLNPALTLIPIAVEHPVTTDELAMFARSHQLLTPPAADGVRAVDSNLWGRTLSLVSAGAEHAMPPESAFTLTRPVNDCPQEPATIDLYFDSGVPMSINRVAMPFVDLVQTVVTIAGRHGVGRQRIAVTSGEIARAPTAGESRAGAGGEAREWAAGETDERAAGESDAWIESPAAAVLHTAHRVLQARLWDGETSAFAAIVRRRLRDALLDGGWSLPLRSALDAFVMEAQRRISGTVRLSLSRGTMAPAD